MLMDNSWQEQNGDTASIFALLDVLAAFNTIDYGILWSQEWEMEMDGTVLFWFRPFLQSWSQLVFNI